MFVCFVHLHVYIILFLLVCLGLFWPRALVCQRAHRDASVVVCVFSSSHGFFARICFFLFLPDYDVVLLSVYVVRLLVFFTFLCAVGLFVSVCSSLLRFKFAGVSNTDAECVR